MGAPVSGTGIQDASVERQRPTNVEEYGVEEPKVAEKELAGVRMPVKL